MSITMTAREFNQHASKALKLAQTSPVFITKWGKIVGVVSNYGDFKQSTPVKPKTFAELFAAPKNSQTLADAFFVKFEQDLEAIRRSNKSRDVDFGEE